MKKIITLLAIIIAATTFHLRADYEKPTTFENLPKQAKEFITKYYSAKEVVQVYVEKGILNTSYDVILENGCKIEFNKNGEWKEISSKRAPISLAIAPRPIQDYVKKNYPNRDLVGIEKKSRGRYQIDLSNGLEIEFDSKFRPREVDVD
ncbi:MAG: PepSY-like domain-containing protein [Porphyromonas sp.]|nr:PepSY-like domain-containing protein [Porphyromonas sp.]